MNDLDRVYADAERFMRRLLLRTPADVGVEPGQRLGWRKLATRGWSLVHIAEHGEHTQRITAVGNAPLAFRIKAADFFGKLLDAIQPVAPASDDGVRGIDETLRKLSGDD
jgi:hypothetical protein